jgi:acetyl-CoA acetyltransferase
MTAERHAWRIDGVRTPRAIRKPSGALAGIHTHELMAQRPDNVVARTGVGLEQIDNVVVGNRQPAWRLAGRNRRSSALTATWPYKTFSCTLNCNSDSAQTAVTLATTRVIPGMQDLAVAGGFESDAASFITGIALSVDGGFVAV